MCLQRNIEDLSCNHRCSDKTISITYSECVVAALGIQHAMGVGHIVICSLAGSKIYFKIIL
jgi:hypothetical protein